MNKSKALVRLKRNGSPQEISDIIKNSQGCVAALFPAASALIAEVSTATLEQLSERGDISKIYTTKVPGYVIRRYTSPNMQLAASLFNSYLNSPGLAPRNDDVQED